MIPNLVWKLARRTCVGIWLKIDAWDSVVKCIKIICIKNRKYNPTIYPVVDNILHVRIQSDPCIWNNNVHMRFQNVNNEIHFAKVRLVLLATRVSEKIGQM